jgi:hypothetical protein
LVVDTGWSLALRHFYDKNTILVTAIGCIHSVCRAGEERGLGRGFDLDAAVLPMYGTA